MSCLSHLTVDTRVQNVFGVCGVTVLSSVLNGSGGLEGGRGLAHSPGGSYCWGGDTTPLEKAISSPGPPSPNILTVWLASLYYVRLVGRSRNRIRRAIAIVLMTAPEVRAEHLLRSKWLIYLIALHNSMYVKVEKI